MIVPIQFPYHNSVQADQFPQADHTWEPQLHFTGTLNDPVEVRFIESLLHKYGRHVVAHYICSPYAGSYSVELLFGTDDRSQKAKVACLAEYHSAFITDGQLKATVAKEHSLNSGKFRLIVVRPAMEPEVISIDVSERRAVIKSTVGDCLESIPYPPHLGLPLRVICVEDGIYRPLAYNRWGLVGSFVVTRYSVDGRSLSLTDKQIDQVLIDLEQADDGYLNPECGVLNAFREPFATHGIPPSGWVPKAGRWFNR